jgi:hypothetical protein
VLYYFWANWTALVFERSAWPVYDSLMALALVCEKQERWEDAARAIKTMSQLQPDGQDWRAVLLRMRDTIKAQEAEKGAAAPPSESLAPRESNGAPPTEKDK